MRRRALVVVAAVAALSSTAVSGLVAGRQAAKEPWPLPRPLLIADRNNDRIIIVTAAKKVIWVSSSLRQPDDAFFTPGGKTVITNEEFDDTITEVSLATGKPVWSYGHAGVAGSSPGYLRAPDDAYRLADGTTIVADIQNCRIVSIAKSGKVLRVLGGRCVHDPPRGFASPNGDTPLADGGLIVTEIGGWIDRLDRKGRLVWAVRSPVPYPSDAHLLPDGKILVASFHKPGKVVILDHATGRVSWSFGDASGPNFLNQPSLATMFGNGIVAITDDWNHRVILVDLKTKKIVWQYGHTGVAGSGPDYLNKPDGLDLAPPAVAKALLARAAHR